MFKALKARKPRKCDGYKYSREIPKGSLYVQYKSFGRFEGFFWINDSLCLDCAFEQMCHTEAWCLGFRLEATKDNFEQLKRHEKFAGLLRDSREVKPGVYIVGGVEIGGSTYHHVSIHNYLERERNGENNYD